MYFPDYFISLFTERQCCDPAVDVNDVERDPDVVFDLLLNSANTLKIYMYVIYIYVLC